MMMMTVSFQTRSVVQLREEGGSLGAQEHRCLFAALSPLNHTVFLVCSPCKCTPAVRLYSIEERGIWENGR